MAHGARITGAPPGAQPVHVVGAVAVSLPLDPWMGLAALATYSGLSRRRLCALLHDPARPLRHVHAGGKVLVRASWFDAWAQAHECRKVADLDALVEDTLRDLARPKKVAWTP